MGVTTLQQQCKRIASSSLDRIFHYILILNLPEPEMTLGIWHRKYQLSV